MGIPKILSMFSPDTTSNGYKVFPKKPVPGINQQETIEKDAYK